MSNVESEEIPTDHLHFCQLFKWLPRYRIPYSYSIIIGLDRLFRKSSRALRETCYFL